MSESKIALQAIKLKGHISSDRKLEITEEPVELPEGEVEVIVLYPQPLPDVISVEPCVERNSITML